MSWVWKSLGEAFQLGCSSFFSPFIDLYGEGESFQTVGRSGSSQAGE